MTDTLLEGPKLKAYMKRAHELIRETQAVHNLSWFKATAPTNLANTPAHDQRTTVIAGTLPARAKAIRTSERCYEAFCAWQNFTAEQRAKFTNYQQFQEMFLAARGV